MAKITLQLQVWVTLDAEPEDLQALRMNLHDIAYEAANANLFNVGTQAPVKMWSSQVSLLSNLIPH